MLITGDRSKFKIQLLLMLTPPDFIDLNEFRG